MNSKAQRIVANPVPERRIRFRVRHLNDGRARLVQFLEHFHDFLGLARMQVAGLLGCKENEIVFTSGGSEANNHALKGVFFASARADAHIITTQVEHPAVINGCSELFADVFGKENGIGARSAVGTGSLPGNIAVEIEGIFEIQ